MKRLLTTRLWGIITQRLARIRVSQYAMLCGTLSVLISHSAFAILGLGGAFYVGPIPNTASKHGYVMARSVVINPATGQPILVSYNNDGTEAGPINVSSTYPVDQLLITSAAAYHAEQQRLDVYNQQHKNTLAKGARLMSRTAFLAASFTAADNQTAINTPNLPRSINSVLVRGQSDRLTTDPNQLVLLSFSFDLTQSSVSENSVSLVVSPEGVVLAQSNQNIGYRTGFYGNPNQAPKRYSFGSVENTDTIFGPVPYVKTNVAELVYPGGVDVTNQNGKYGFTFFMPTCPVGGWEFKTDVWAELKYTNILPTGSPARSYYLRTIGYDYCYADLVPALLVPAVTNILATISKPYYQSNLYADVMFLTGAMYISNSQGQDVPLGETTHTAFTTPADDKLQHFYDFNGDGQADTVIRGQLKTVTDENGIEEEKFEANAEGNLQGLYFDTPQAEQAPDLMRVIDQERRKTSVGILESISSADLRNTDVLFFRESTGQLIMERKGLKEAELRSGDVQLDDDNQLVSYRVMLRGPRDWSLNIGGKVNRRESYEEWATNYQLTEPFQRKDSDYIRPGESIKIVAINRASGYMGTASAKLTRSHLGDLTILAPTIKLSPPNLKVWAERNYDVAQGLTQGENRNYTIGAEGAALTSDKTITIYTQWLDEYGRPLPDELGLDNGEQYGFTGRLAKVVSPNQLQGVGAGNDLASFAIAPGRKTQVINVGSNLTTAEHYYVHVIGKAKDQECSGSGSCPSFTDLGSTTPYDTRPNLLVPFLVPLPDEDLTWLTYHAYRNILADDTVTDKPNKPLPAYSWAYRPEYQFSQYGLEMQEINATSTNANGTETSTNILSSDSPTIASSDDYITALYSLISSNNDRLTPIDGPQELVLALGEEEQLITIGEDQSITFSNIDHLAQLDPEDFLSMRLYANNDASNILWEYAFNHIAVSVVDDDVLQNDIVYVNADNSTLDLAATVYGYASASDNVKRNMPQKIKWQVISGNASITPAIASVDENGNAAVTVNVAPNSSNRVQIEATAVDDEFKDEAQIEIAVIPGVPASINLSNLGGTAHIKGRGAVEIQALAKDKNGNVVTNGTGISFREQGHIKVTSTTGITDKGVVKATVIAGSVAGTYNIKATAGNAESDIGITANTLNVELIGLPAQFIAGQKYSLTAKVTGSNQDLSKIFVDLGASAGAITSMGLYTKANGEVNFTYKAPQEAGTYQLAAKVDLENPIVEPITVIAHSKSMKPAQYFMVSGTSSGADSVVNNYDDTESRLTYTLNNTLTLNGVQGESWSINLNNKHLVNREPLYFNRFNANGWDVLHQYKAQTQNITRLTTVNDGIGAIKFSRTGTTGVVQGTWKLPKIDSAESEQPAFNFWLLPKDDGEILTVAGGAIEIAQFNNNIVAKIRAKLPDDTIANYNLELPVITNQLHAIAVGVKSGAFYLAIDDQETTTPLSGRIDYVNVNENDETNNWLILGKNYAGQVSGLRIYDWSTSPLIEPTSNVSGVFDSTGEANVSLKLSNSFLQQSITMPSVSVGIDNNNQTAIVNVLNKHVVEKLAGSYFAVQGTGSASTQAVLQSIPMDELFPAASSGVRTFVQRFAAQKNSESSLKNALANIAWLSHSTQFNGLAPQVKTLQRYIANSQNQHLASYFTEYLQEATVQSAQGNHFWLRSMATSLTVWSELVNTNPAIANLIAKSIENSGDFWLWNRIMSLPADGWATDVIPIPRVDVTCDTVIRNVNVGTPLAYNTTPCRATGQQMATMLGVFLDVDPSINNDPVLLTTYMSTLLMALKQMPLEYSRIFPPVGGVLAKNNLADTLFPKAHAAGPFVYAFRVIAVALKQGIRKGLGGGPANFVAFLQGGTTSRVDTLEMLTALAYLGSRLEESNCEGCQKLNRQVSETVIGDMGTWFAGLALSKKGVLTEPDLAKKSCTITGNAHGKAFELLGTAAYHAMFEFGGSNAGKYKILLSDPRTLQDNIHVGLMRNVNGTLTSYDGSPHQRKPDLVLQGGSDDGQRHWVEFKSWRYHSDYSSAGQLKRGKFPLWDGVKKGKALTGYTVNAHRQHFLDYAASQEALNEDYWDKQGLLNQKPNKHDTWFQVWAPGKRTWKHLQKKGNKWVVDDKSKITRNVATPWLETSNITNGVVTSISPQFKALQRWLSTAPKMNADAFESSIGYKKSEHETNYVEKQISTSAADLANSSIKPFTLSTFFALHLGESAGKALKQQIIAEFGDGDIAELQNAIDSGALSEEQIEALRKNITDKIMESLGPIELLAADIPLLSTAENYVADLILGQEVEAVRKWVSEVELPEEYFEQLCEAL